jgi:peptidoglycan/LPS O-acetylase OafA/YrhL
MIRYADPVVGKSAPIQGLRALAVISVIAFHLNPAWLPGGFLGVDIFFVISGLLIARMLSNDIHTNGQVRVLRFYGKRLYRIAPAALTVTLASFPLAYFALLPFDLRDYGASMVGVTTLTLNKMVANNIGYFSPLAETQPLLHFWSLMVEIHFYLLIPFVFYFLRRIELIRVAVLILLVASLIYADWLSSWDPKNSYFLLPSRAWELLFGALLFLFIATRENTHPSVCSVSWALPLSVIGLLGFLWLFSASTKHPSFLSVVPVAATGVLIWSVLSDPADRLARLFSARWLVLLGNMSFSLYLWHYPFIVFFKADTGWLSYDDMVLAVFGTLVCSTITYLAIERPSFSFHGKVDRPQIGLLGWVGVGGVVTFLGIYGFVSDGFESSWIKRQTETVVTAYRLSQNASNFRRYDEENDCTFRVEAFDDSVKNRIDLCAERHEKGILIVGDSHAIGLWRLAKKVAEATESQRFVVGIARGGCKPYKQAPGCSLDKMSNDADYLGLRFSRVLYVQAGSSLVTATGAPRHENVQSVLMFLDSLSRSVDTAWIGPRIEPGIDQRRFVRAGCGIEQPFDPVHKANISKLDSYLGEELSSHRVRFISHETLSLERFGDCDRLFWRDSNHWSPSGIDELAGRPEVRALIFYSEAM